MDYAKTILFNRQDLVRDLLRRLSEQLKPYENGLNLLFADLFRGRLPVDWRERWRNFVAQQAALGYVTDPWSVRDMERFIFEWARFCELLPVEEMRTAYAPAGPSRAAMPRSGNETDTAQPQRGPGESEFDRQLAEATGVVNEIATILESLAVKIDSAPINTPKMVHTEVERIDGLIRAYNAALERAREIWLREELSGAAYQRLLALRGPTQLGLPAFTDDDQRQRAAEQQQRIFERLGQTLPPDAPHPPPVDAADSLVCMTLGGGVEVLAYQREGKWRVSKLLALSSARLTPEEQRQFRMPEPASHYGVKLAALVVSFILARKTVSNVRTVPKQRQKGFVGHVSDHAGGSHPEDSADEPNNNQADFEESLARRFEEEKLISLLAPRDLTPLFWRGAIVLAKARGGPTSHFEWHKRNRTQILPAAVGAPASYWSRSKSIYIPSNVARAIARVGLTSRIDPDDKTRPLGDIYNESFHAYFDLNGKQLGWVKAVVSRQTQYSWNTRAAMAEEAMSELINQIATAIETREEVPTYEQVLALPKTNAWYRNITPQHNEKKQAWYGNAQAGLPISEELYYATFWLVYNGDRAPWTPQKGPAAPPTQLAALKLWWAGIFRRGWSVDQIRGFGYTPAR